MKQINITNNQLTVYALPVPPFVQVALGLLLFIVSALIAAIFYAMTDGGGIHLSYFIGLGILGFLGWRFIRLWYWNKNGKEVFTIENNKLKYIADYGRFKDGAQEIELSQEIRAEIFDHDQRPHKCICFHNQEVSTNVNEAIFSVIKLKYSEEIDFYKLEHELNVWLIKHR